MARVMGRVVNAGDGESRKCGMFWLTRRAVIEVATQVELMAVRPLVR